jgi:hypothetical protein
MEWMMKFKGEKVFIFCALVLAEEREKRERRERRESVIRDRNNLSRVVHSIKDVCSNVRKVNFASQFN